MFLNLQKKMPHTWDSRIDKTAGNLGLAFKDGCRASSAERKSLQNAEVSSFLKFFDVENLQPKPSVKTEIKTFGNLFLYNCTNGVLDKPKKIGQTVKKVRSAPACHFQTFSSQPRNGFELNLRFF